MTAPIFDRWAQTYDRARRQLVPCLDDFYDAVIAQLPFDEQAPLHVLDLGAGTGLLSLFVAKQFPNAHLTLVDIADQMLEKARERFADEPQRFAFVCADYARIALPGPFDAVVSGLSIHHLEDEQKRALFRSVHDSLAPGGAFINADQVLGATPEIEQRYRATWLRQVRGRVDEADLAAALERMKDDKMATLEAQLAWLREAGFASVDCWYKSYNFAVFGGRV